jgi:hypothetical protein
VKFSFAEEQLLTELLSTALDRELEKSAKQVLSQILFLPKK